jgi:hypothetical protein
MRGLSALLDEALHLLDVLLVEDAVAVPYALLVQVSYALSWISRVMLEAPKGRPLTRLA